MYTRNVRTNFTVREMRPKNSNMVLRFDFLLSFFTLRKYVFPHPLVHIEAHGDRRYVESALHRSYFSLERRRTALFETLSRALRERRFSCLSLPSPFSQLYIYIFIYGRLNSTWAYRMCISVAHMPFWH